MSTFENDQYCYRETYFVLFRAERRPTMEAVRKTLGGLTAHFTLTATRTDDEDRLESLTILAPDDFAAMDVSYIEGEEVIEYAEEAIQEMRTTACEPDQAAKLDQIPGCDARLDVWHFEEIIPDDSDDDDEFGGMLDPTALLLALEALAQLTDGVAIDPQAGTPL